MRKTVVALGIFMTVNSVSTHIPTITHTKQEVPAYAKWGQLAIKETQSKYPNANIIDYLHEGSESKVDSTIEKFKLWLKDGDKEFGVFVRIEYTTVTEKVITIEMEETSR
ncbi:DUF3889 domain-containing protein [Sporosarcina sp. ANT_H38]|uniref:DUF3889 domain-containing protein n=1 Tax=Sporosarcina sp. ANT_H38 TaxID=2597358 RepID=UPI0011F3EF0E|nr:DUF3889 domain-containing protein [Sporosarcina sp. ANT_H38]KAA0966196.1 DUF3889 domain-containing protein [Sporosarcina sp. ANT_H38]